MNAEITNETMTVLSESDSAILGVIVAATIYMVAGRFAATRWKIVIHDLLLWVILVLAFMNISVPPVDADDEITSAILLVAYCVGQIARELIKKSDKAEA